MARPSPISRVVFVIGCVSCNKFSHFRQNMCMCMSSPSLRLESSVLKHSSPPSILFRINTLFLQTCPAPSPRVRVSEPSCRWSPPFAHAKHPPSCQPHQKQSHHCRSRRHQQAEWIGRGARCEPSMTKSSPTFSAKCGTTSSSSMSCDCVRGLFVSTGI